MTGAAQGASLTESPPSAVDSAAARRDVVKSLVRHTFNAAADQFDDDRVFLWDYCGRRTIERLDLAPGHRVLDLCCGAGASALPAAERVGPTGSVLGVDLADRLLDLARAKAADRDLRNVQFTVGDVEELDVADGDTDAVVCVMGFYFAQDPVALAVRYRRVLRPGGTFAVTTVGGCVLEPLQSFFLDAFARERPDLDVRGSPLSWERMNTPESLGDILRAAGLVDVEVDQERVGRPVGPDVAWALLLGSGYRLLLSALDVDALGRVREAIGERMGTDRSALVTTDLLFARARRA